MKNRYDIILAAGSRINGLQKFSSNSERLHHEQHVAELRLEINVLEYHKSLGFITAELTEEEFEKYKTDPRILTIEKVVIPEMKKTNFITRDTASNNQWHLKQLTNKLNSKINVLSGFKFELVWTHYGIPIVDFSDVAHTIVVTSRQNKLLHNNTLYNYELSLTNYLNEYTPGKILTIGSPYVPPLFPLNTDIYVGYNYLTDSLELKVNLVEGYIPIYTVKVKLYDDPITIYYTAMNSGVLGFYDLKLLPETTDIYAATIQGEGVDIIIGDCQLNIHNSDIEGNATILYNAYADIYETQYGAWDSNNPLIDQHGTACAVAAAGKTCGIANKARILGVTCLDTSEDRGNNSFNVLNAFAWILQYIIDKKVELAPKPYPVVVSLSLGTSTGIIATAQDSCVAAMIAEGAIVVIAAGNDNAPHNESPYTPEAILVGASTEAITPCSFTNYGPHIDVYAPGEDIFSTVLGYTRWQGTSVATPHVSGLCALYLSLFPSSTAAEVKEAILQVSIDAVTYNKDATTNRFAQNPFYGFINREEITTPILQEEFIYVDIPYFIGFDGEKIYGSLNELTLSTIASAVVSAGKSESVDLATAIRLVP